MECTGLYHFIDDQHPVRLLALATDPHLLPSIQSSCRIFLKNQGATGYLRTRRIDPATLPESLLESQFMTPVPAAIADHGEAMSTKVTDPTLDAIRQAKCPTWYRENEIKRWLMRPREDDLEKPPEIYAPFIVKHLQLAFEKGWQMRNGNAITLLNRLAAVEAAMTGAGGA